MSDREVTDQITTQIQEKHPNFYTVIQVDKSYVM